MAINRRDIFRFAAGSGVGAAFTPIPWKLLDDSAIWTQNWRLTPKLPRGEVTTRFTACTLCPAGCAVKARCVNGVPFSVAGVAGDPNSGGALCAAGIGAHHLSYRPDRVHTVLYRGKPSKLARAMQAVRSAPGPLAILDLRPGRAVSEAYRKLAEQVKGVYSTPSGQEATFEAVRRMVDGQTGFGIDLERTKTLLSFGAPVLDGWAAPGRVWAARNGFRLIQADAVNSRTATLADSWLPIRPGTEGALALAIGHVMLRDGIAHKDASRASDFAAYQSLTARFTPEFASGVTGLAPDRIVAAAHEFAAGAPAVAVGGGDPGGGPLGAQEEIAIAALNLLAGSVGRSGGLLARKQPDGLRGTDFAEIPDGTLGVLFIDAANAADAIAWDVVKRKLSTGAVVIAHAAFRGGAARHADFVVPAPTYLESLDEAPAPFHSTRSSFALAPALLRRPGQAMDAAGFLSQLAAALGVTPPGATEELLKQRAATLHDTKRGTVFSYASGQSKPAAEFKSAEELWTALNEGGCWVDDEPAAEPPTHFRLLGTRPDNVERLARAGEGRLNRRDDFPLTLAPRGWRGGTGDAALAPLMTKLYQESRLRPDEILVDPQTAGACGLEDGCRAVVETPCGHADGRVRVAAGTVPGTLQAEIAPLSARLMDICGSDGCTWRGTSARIRRAG